MLILLMVTSFVHDSRDVGRADDRKQWQRYFKALISLWRIWCALCRTLIHISGRLYAYTTIWWLVTGAESHPHASESILLLWLHSAPWLQSRWNWIGVRIDHFYNSKPIVSRNCLPVNSQRMDSGGPWNLECDNNAPFQQHPHSWEWAPSPCWQSAHDRRPGRQDLMLAYSSAWHPIAVMQQCSGGKGNNKSNPSVEGSTPWPSPCRRTHDSCLEVDTSISNTSKSRCFVLSYSLRDIRTYKHCIGGTSP